MEEILQPVIKSMAKTNVSVLVQSYMVLEGMYIFRFTVSAYRCSNFLKLCLISKKIIRHRWRVAYFLSY